MTEPVRQKISGEKVALVATMPKSGTWFSAYFFYFLHHAIMKSPQIPLPLLDDFVSESHIRLNKSLGIDRFFLCHTTCPGYRKVLGGYERAWNDLKFHAKGYTYGSLQIDENPTIFDPEINTNARVVFLYRNPLDQALSAFRYRRDRSNKDYIDDIKTPGQLLRAGVLESYLKQFVTFRMSKVRYPNQIMMVPYEDLVSNPARYFTSIVKHLTHGYINDEHQVEIDQAVRQARKDNLVNIERLFARSLAGDQIDPNSSHIKDGGIGSWQKSFTQDDINYTTKRLAEFGLKLKDFQMFPRSAISSSVTKTLVDSSEQMPQAIRMGIEKENVTKSG